MKLSDYRETYYTYSGKASDISRQLAFAGIGIIWIFKTTASPIARIPPDLLLPFSLLAVTLAFDLLQYISATAVWGIFQWYQERKLDDLSEDEELESPSILKLPQFIFFTAKLVAIILAYITLTKYIWIVWYKTTS